MQLYSIPKISNIVSKRPLTTSSPGGNTWQHIFGGVASELHQGLVNISQTNSRKDFVQENASRVSENIFLAWCTCAKQIRYFGRNE